MRPALTRSIGLAVAFGLALHAQAATWFVRADADGSNAGTSWANAFSDLQSALAAAVEGDEIWVAAGVYRPGPPLSQGGDRNAAFVLRDGIALYGGFRGDETLIDQRDYTTHLSVLSGDLNGDDAPGPGFVNTADNAFQVLVALEPHSMPILDGFTITAGHADGIALGADPASKDQGSGLNIYDASPIVRNCIFERNWSANHGAVNDHGHETLVQRCVFRGNFSQTLGPSLYIHHHSMTLAEDCTFVQNSTLGEGAGVYSRSEGGAIIRHCMFLENSALKGGGMYHAPGSATSVEDCAYCDNVAERGGGMYMDAASPLVVGTSFLNNSATLGGGGIYADLSNSTVIDCSFTLNTADVGDDSGSGGGGGNGGGGLWASGGTVEVTRCVFTSNVGSLGGGLYTGDENTAQIDDCTFSNNEALEAGGAYILLSAATVSNCTFTGNLATGGVFAVGGGLANYFSSVTVDDCTFTRNAANLGGGGIYNEGNSTTISGCGFYGNRAYGEAQGWGGGAFNGYFNQASYVNCEFVGNTANRGGGMFSIVLSGQSIINCTLASNQAFGNSPEGDAGGLHALFNTTPLLTNCIFAFHTAPHVLGETVVAAHCGFTSQGGPGLPGDGSFTADPRFVRPPTPGTDGLWATDDDDYGDLRLRPGSRCIDAGNGDEIPAGFITDMRGNPRFVDDPGTSDSAGAGPPPVIDCGAMEFQGITCRGDFNASGVTSVQDIFDFLQAWFANDPTADLDRSGTLTAQDLFTFLAAWFGGCP